MKCKRCHEMFETVPCEHPTGTCDAIASVIPPGFRKYYAWMKKKCPCKDCLINTICTDGKECEIAVGIETITVDVDKNGQIIIHYGFYPYR
jgi:hypothetical protein